MNPYSRSFISVTASLAMFYCIFIAAVYARDSSLMCTIFSGIFHYCFLTVVFGFCGNTLHALISITRGPKPRLPDYIAAVIFSKTICIPYTIISIYSVI